LRLHGAAHDACFRQNDFSMIGHVIISHGLESSPAATTATALAMVAERLGWSEHRPDYRDLDAIGKLGDVLGRIERLHGLAARVEGPLVLAGSSMGAFISARVSLQLPVRGLFLMAPPIQLEGYDIRLDATKSPTTIVHGWDDELIPALEVARWASRRRDHTVFVNDSHRLATHVDFCAEEFGRFLQGLA
jgi:pimeloyl-ACP methyl ester carboxylesterase